MQATFRPTPIPYEPMTIGCSLAVLAEVRRPDRVGELGPELEDVADLDPVAEDDRPPARRAGVALAGVGDVGDDVRREIAPDIDVPVVEALAVRAGDEVRRAGDELVDDDRGVAAPIGEPYPGSIPAALISSTVAGRSPPVASTALTSFVSLTSWSPRTIAVTRRPSPVTKNAALAVRLSGMSRKRASVAIVVVPGVATSSIGSGRPRERIRLRHDRDLPVGRVAARSHRTRTSSPAGLRTMNSCAWLPPMIPTSLATAIASRPEPLEDPDVGGLLGLVAHVEPGLVAVAAVGVLHDELADADQAAAGARLVAALRLEVIDHHRQLAVALDDVREEQPDDLLVGHRQDHVPAVAVLEPGQLRADRVVAPARPPDVGRVDDRHLHLLAADPVHLLADDLLDPLVDPEAERQERVDPRAELADVARPQEQAVRRHLRIGGVVAQGREEQLGETHGTKNTRPQTSAIC